MVSDRLYHTIQGKVRCLDTTTLRFALFGVTCCLALALTGALADPPTAATGGSTFTSGTKSAALLNNKSDSEDAHARLLTGRSGAEARAGEPDRREQVVRTALTFRGSPYRRGGVSSKSGFDCSGFVQTMCAKWGIYLPRAAREQFSASVGKRVLPYELKAGDLVFFSETYRHGTSHVGIYIGDGKIIHAATPAQGVIVSDLTEEYLRKHYCGAIRIDLDKLPAVPGHKSSGSSTMAGATITYGKRDAPIKSASLGPIGLPIP